MSLPIKIKDEPLDPGYGDVIPKSSKIKTEPIQNSDNDSNAGLDDLQEILNSSKAFLENDSNEDVKSPAKSNNTSVKVKNEPEEIPDDFFDCLDNIFLKDIANDVEDKDDDDENKIVDSPASNSSIAIGGNNEIDIPDDTPLLEEIEKLTKKIEKRKHKLAKHTSALAQAKSSKQNSELQEVEKRIKKEPDEDDERNRRKHRKEKRRSKGERTSRRSGSRHSSEERSVEYRRRRRSRSSSSDSYSSKRRRTRSRTRTRSRSHDRTSRKRYRSRSRSRSPKSSHSRSRYRRTRSRSRSPYASYSRDKYRSRSRSLDKESNHKTKKSFLDELKETLAKKGLPFPEKEIINAKSIMKEYSEIMNNNQSNHKPCTTISNTSSVNIENELGNNSSEASASESMNLDTMFPKPIKIKTEPVDETEKMMEDTENQEIDFPRPFVVKQEPQDDIEEPETSSKASSSKAGSSTKSSVLSDFTHRYMKVKEEKKNETPLQRRERVLDLCSDIIKKLHLYEQNKPMTRFMYTPTVIVETDIEKNIEYRSPLHRINNVKFKFNSTTNDIDLKYYGLKKLPDVTERIARIIGFDALTIMEKLNHKDLPYSLKMLKKSNDDNDGDEDVKPDKFYKPFYTSTGTQTEPYSCSACIIRQLRKFQDIGIQMQPFTQDGCCQVDPQMLANEMQSILGNMMIPGVMQQPHYQQSFYPPNNVQMQPAMMYNNYGGGPVSSVSQPLPSPHQPNQFMQPYGGSGSGPYYPGQSQPAIITPTPMMNMNMMPQMQNSVGFTQSSMQSKYPPLKAHPGPRAIPSTSSAVRRTNLIVPKTSSSTKEK